MRRVVTLLLVVALSGCGISRRTEPPPEVQEDPYRIERISRTKELGRKVLDQAKEEYGLVTDEEVIALVQEVGREIVEASGGVPSTYHFFVVKEEKINAFALPGGYIFLFDGLLKNLSSVDALAGVLAHEVGHVSRNHFYDRRIEIANIATLAAVVLASMAGGGRVAAPLAQAVNITQQLKYSREHEREADFFAIKVLRQSGYSPDGLYDFFRILSPYERTSPDVPPYLSTHPGVSERMAMIATAMKKGGGTYRHKREWDWGRVLTILYTRDPDGLSLLIKRLERGGALEEERRKYLTALYALKKGRYREAISLYREVVKLNPKEPIYHSDLAEAYLRLKQYSLAKAEAMEAIEISKALASPYLTLAVVEQAAGRHAEAIQYLKEAERLSPERPSIHYRLALSYRYLKDRAREAYHLGRYFRLKFEPDQALLHLKRALSTTGDRELAVKIRREMEEIMREGV